jgi:hypothetical protein
MKPFDINIDRFDDLIFYLFTPESGDLSFSSLKLGTKNKKINFCTKIKLKKY